ASALRFAAAAGRSLDIQLVNGNDWQPPKTAVMLNAASSLIAFFISASPCKSWNHFPNDAHGTGQHQDADHGRQHANHERNRDEDGKTMRFLLRPEPTFLAHLIRIDA